MADLHAILEQRVRTALEKAFGPDGRQVDPQVRVAQNRRFGHYQVNAAMGLARQLGRPPRQVAEQLLEALELDDWCQAPQVAGPGFINLRLHDQALGRLAGQLAADRRLGLGRADKPQTVVVDYSSPNVAKEMHVGHLRSTIIGDALARVLELVGHRVIRQNHVGDWGTQFGMLIEYLLAEHGEDLSGLEIPDLNGFYQAAKQRFDSDPAFAEAARRRVVALQGGDPMTVKLWRALVAESARHFNTAYRRLGVGLTDEHLCPESFYNDRLAGVVQALEQAGLTRISQGATVVYPDGFTGRDGQPLAMIIRKSDGGYLYATTDLAALRYRLEQLGADRVIYVTDARQKQHFAMVFQVARQAGWVRPEVRLEHVPFGTILGPDNRPFKTRSGQTVRLADLLDEAEARAAAIVAQKNPDLDADQQRRVARVVGIGAVKYADLSNDRIKDYVFSWPRLLAMEGNTAPYLQYAYARICSIFRKAGGRPAPPTGRPLVIEHPAERQLVLTVAQWPQVVGQVAASLEPHRLCNWLYELATDYSSFYENCPVLRAEDAARRADRLTLCDLAARALKEGLNLLGIEVLEQM